MRGGILAVALVALAIAGYSSSDSPSDGKTSSSAPAPPPTTAVDMHGTITAKSRLGDLSTFNPCSLLDLSTLPAGLNAAPLFQQEQGSVDACDFTITAGRKGALLVIGRLVRTLPSTVTGPAEPLGRGLAVRGGTLVDNDCEAAVELGDGTYLISEVDLNLNATARPGTGLEPACQAAHEGAVDVADVLPSSAPIRHRGAPENLLTGVNPCDLVQGQQVDGFTLEHGADQPGGSCTWYPTYEKQPVYRLAFTTAIPPSGPQVVIAGRSTFRFGQQAKPVMPAVPSDGTESICQTETVEGPSTGNLVEIAEVTVTDQAGQQDHDCLLATDLAKVAWAELPPAAN